MSKQVEMDELEVVIANMAALEDCKEELLKFEARMCKLVEETLEPMLEKINSETKALEEKHVFPFESYMEDFRVYDWEPGSFHEMIRDSLKAQLKDLLNRE